MEYMPTRQSTQLYKRRKRRIRRKYNILFSVYCTGIIAVFILLSLKPNSNEYIIAPTYDFSSYGEDTTPGAIENSSIENSSIENNIVHEANESWNLILVNEWNTIPEMYDIELTTVAGGEKVDSRIHAALLTLFDAAYEDGISMKVVSGHRTAERQQQILDDKIAEYIASGYDAQTSEELALKFVAVPGTSEHQLGIAVDINADQSTREETYTWLEENGYKYGFILRYPADKQDITGVNYEPWHYRYVGTDAAYEMFTSGLCLEEYLSF